MNLIKSLCIPISVYHAFTWIYIYSWHNIKCALCNDPMYPAGARCDAARASVRRPPRAFCSPGIKGSFTAQPFSGPKTITLKRTTPRVLFVNCPAFDGAYNNATAVCNPSNEQALRFRYVTLFFAAIHRLVNVLRPRSYNVNRDHQNILLATFVWNKIRVFICQLLYCFNNAPILQI